MADDVLDQAHHLALVGRAVGDSDTAPARCEHSAQLVRASHAIAHVIEHVGRQHDVQERSAEWQRLHVGRDERVPNSRSRRCQHPEGEVDADGARQPLEVRAVATADLRNPLIRFDRSDIEHPAKEVERRHPFAHAQLKDEDLSVDFARNTTPQDKVAVVVTAPLTVNEDWKQMQPGELRVFLDGQVQA